MQVCKGIYSRAEFCMDFKKEENAHASIIFTTFTLVHNDFNDIDSKLYLSLPL